MDRDKAIRAARLTLSGMLEKNRHATAVGRAGGQVSPSKYLPDVPRAVHAGGGSVLPKGYSLKVDREKMGVLAHYNGQPVGQLTLMRDPESNDLTAFQMAVHPKHQRKGLMSAMHDAAEEAFGPMQPDKTLTDDGFAFWKRYRPDAVSNNLRFHADKLIGQTMQTRYGPGTVKSVGSNGMNTDLTDPEYVGSTGWAKASDNEDALRGLGIDPSTLKYASGGRAVHAGGGKAAFQQGNHPDVPDVVYHGTNRDIQSFDPNAERNYDIDPRNPASTDTGWFGKGHYFAPKPKRASYYAEEAARRSQGQGAQVYPVHLSMKNPFVVHMKDTDSGATTLDKALSSAGVPMHSRGYRMPSEQTAALIDMGHDGVIAKRKGKTEEIVAFHPNQIKSAIGNQGTFDSKDPDITKADGGEVEKKRDFMRDNPGGEWLEGKQAMAAKHPDRKFVVGSITGVIGGRSSVFLPTHVLKGITGLENEVRRTGDPRYDALLSDAQKGGFDPEQKGNKVVVAVNHFGQPYLLEGNTRVAVAHSMGIPKVKAEVRYWNGAENVDGPMHPENVFNMASDSPDVAKATGGPVMGYVPMASLTVPKLAVARAPQYQQQQGGVGKFSDSLNSLMDTVEGFKKKPDAAADSPSAASGSIPLPDEGYEATGMYAPFQSAIDRMIADAPGKITVASGYRTPEEQEALWNQHAAKYPDPEVRDDYVARAGQSSHNYGLAADLSYADQEAIKWAQENAPKYGLNFRMGHENWHIEPSNIWELRNAMTVPGYATGGRIGKAMLLTRGFTKDGKSAINALKLKGK
jgi:hypothetical protein